MFDYNLEDEISYITGTDCHDWSVYPLEDERDKKKAEDYPYTYAKCLPTFKGLVMAITDHKRLNRVNNFFNVSNNDIEYIQLKHKDQLKEIPLSKGINVIIGDNSIGKSMLLHGITNFTKLGKEDSKLKAGYKKYLKELDISVITKIENEKLFTFDKQGEVRSKFEGDKLKFDDLLSGYFPPSIDSKKYRNIILNQVDYMLTYLENKFKIDKQFDNLLKFKINYDTLSAESLSFVDNLSETKGKTKNIQSFIDKISTIIIEIQELLKIEMKLEDSEYLNEVLERFKKMKKNYEKDKKIISSENKKIDKVSIIIKDIEQEHNVTVSDVQKMRTEFNSKTEDTIKDFIKLTLDRQKLDIFTPKIEEQEIEIESRLISDYEFISKLNIDCINDVYFNDLISEVLKKDESIDWATITENDLKEKCNQNKIDTSIPILESIRTILTNKISEDFKEGRSIILNGDDKFKELSSGMNAKIYFDLVAYEDKKSGIYIIDQPEDNISQSSIKTLLTRFKIMALYRQIIIVTHNPQFIVNLDIDNLIFLSKDDNNLKIQSGALEYECEEYKILDIVANNIDGGLDTIKKRWKRYEKNIRVL